MTASLAATAGRRAGFITRLAAFVADVFIFGVGIRGAIWLLDLNNRVFRRFAPPVDLGKLLLLVAPLIIALYLVVFWRLRGQTPGKWLLGIRVVALGGGPVGVGRALARVLGYVLSALPLDLGFLWILGRQRRGFHDHLANTEVVYVQRKPRGKADTSLPLRRLSPA